MRGISTSPWRSLGSEGGVMMEEAGQRELQSVMHTAGSAAEAGAGLLTAAWKLDMLDAVEGGKGIWG